MEHVNTRNIIPDYQFGFTKGKSTSHPLYNLKTHIKTRLNMKESTGVLLLDIEKAFDRTWHDGLIFKLIQKDFPIYLSRMIHSFLKGRNFQVKVDDKLSNIFNIKFGVPQGAILSPILYNIYTSDAPSFDDCIRALYADDTALYISSKFRADITKGLRNGLKKYIDFFHKWKIKINVEKTQAIFHTRRRTREIPRRPLFIQTGMNIPWSTEPVKYLGMLFDKTATMKHHIDYVINKTSIATRILYPLINRKSKLNQQNKLLLYKVALRPIMSYATPILNTVAKTHLKKLQVVQNKILKMCLDKPMRFSTSELHNEAKIEYMSVFIQRLAEKFLSSR